MTSNGTTPRPEVGAADEATSRDRHTAAGERGGPGFLRRHEAASPLCCIGPLGTPDALASSRRSKEGAAKAFSSTNPLFEAIRKSLRNVPAGTEPP